MIKISPSREWLYHRYTAILIIIFTLIILNQKNILNFFVLNCNSLIFFPLIIFCNNILSFWILFSFLIILFFHIFHGIHNLVYDYVSNEISRLFSLFILSLILIETLKYFYIYIFFN